MRRLLLPGELAPNRFASGACPFCGSVVLEVQRRGFLERVLARLRGLRPYRCWDLGHRWLASRRPAS